MRLNNLVLLLCILLLFSSTVNGQTRTDSLKQKRLKPLIIGSSVVYAGALVGLHELWYSDFEQEPFHFFDDHNEWKQMDKIGHFYAAFHLSNGGYRALKWAGLQDDKSILWGAIFSAIVLTPIEIFDGFSEGYGASYTDLIANTAGASFFYIQQKAWGEIKIIPKFSFGATDFPGIRPELLGDGLHEQILKDYNGQTYWLSFDLSKMIHGKFPKWLNIAVGYSAFNMVSASSQQSESLGYKPYRQYFIAIDFDFNEYKGRNKFLNTMLDLINMIHLPAPTLEFGEKLKYHWAYH